MRLGLFQTWERALVQGHLREDVPPNWAERQAAIELLSALACVGLGRDRLDVEFDDPLAETIAVEVQRRLVRLDEDWGQAPGVRNVDVRLAAAWAAQLDLVEVRGDGVRFSNSLMQAYLGSRLLGAALLDPGYCHDALRYPQPNRQFLDALVLQSRAAHQGTARTEPGASGFAVGKTRPSTAGAPSRVQPEVVNLLRLAAAKRDDSRVLDMYAAALEIDCVAAEPAHTAVAEEIQALWPRIHAQEPITLEEAKLGIVRRFGGAIRTIDERRRGDSCSAEPAYRQLYEVGCRERSYLVQYAVAQEIGFGGDSAYKALRHVLYTPCRICRAERDGKKPAKRKDGRQPSGSASDDGGWRAGIVSAWLVPMLVSSVGTADGRRADQVLAEQARADLGRWLRHVGLDGRRQGEEDLPVALEIALAQGFKYAANRRPDAPREARWYLAEQALAMLKATHFWFTQLTLIPALCLLNLAGRPQQRGDQQGISPEALVKHWLDIAGAERMDRSRSRSVSPVHPFVYESAQLAVLALKTGRPERYCWIDESGVVGQVGSRSMVTMSELSEHRLWIPPSAGWAALNGRAQQLVADVLLLLNLTDRGAEPPDRERRLKRTNRQDLPPCITRHRQALDPGRTIGMAVPSASGVGCMDGCPFELCPYPPKGAQIRVEMSEAFCRCQRELLTWNPLSRRTAPWQGMRRRQLIFFWADMAERARGPRPRFM